MSSSAALSFSQEEPASGLAEAERPAEQFIRAVGISVDTEDMRNTHAAWPSPAARTRSSVAVKWWIGGKSDASTILSASPESGVDVDTDSMPITVTVRPRRSIELSSSEQARPYGQGITSVRIRR
jgi:hypothetical protein